MKILKIIVLLLAGGIWVPLVIILSVNNWLLIPESIALGAAFIFQLLILVPFISQPSHQEMKDRWQRTGCGTPYYNAPKPNPAWLKTMAIGSLISLAGSIIYIFLII